MGNVDLYTSSELGMDEILALGHQRIAIATGAHWTRSLYSSLEIPQGELVGPGIYTPDDLAGGIVPEGPVLIYDFDNYYLGGVIAEYLAIQGLDVAYATPAGHASAWTIMTNEQPLVHQALHKHHVSINTQSLLTGFDGEQAMLNNIFTGKEQMLAVRSVILVGLRLPNDKLFQNVMSRSEEFADFGIKSVDRIGDVLAAGALVHAVYSGHAYAQQLDQADNSLYLRDIPVADYAPGAVI
jgi:dimethylamine/trimethylamine dehydrogenase